MAGGGGGESQGRGWQGLGPEASQAECEEFCICSESNGEPWKGLKLESVT